MVGGVSLINEATTSSKNQTAAFKKSYLGLECLRGDSKGFQPFQSPSIGEDCICIMTRGGIDGEI